MPGNIATEQLTQSQGVTLSVEDRIAKRHAVATIVGRTLIESVQSFEDAAEHLILRIVEWNRVVRIAHHAHKIIIALTGRILERDFVTAFLVTAGTAHILRRSQLPIAHLHRVDRHQLRQPVFALHTTIAGVGFDANAIAGTRHVVRLEIALHRVAHHGKDLAVVHHRLHTCISDTRQRVLFLIGEKQGVHHLRAHRFVGTHHTVQHHFGRGTQVIEIDIFVATAQQRRRHQRQHAQKNRSNHKFII